ncbi:MAG: hypothetical protein R3272_06885 [Candidatus Promineifilaceae bacterium]|nr:hypothetical protein [Candidatus Promineifilaceae bacterium]
MRPRTFILLVVVLLVAAVVVVLGFVFLGGTDIVTNLLPGQEAAVLETEEEDVEDEVVEEIEEEEEEQDLLFVPVAVARIPIPVGTVIEEDFVRIELRPETNIAVQAGYVFTEEEDVVGRIARTRIEPGQEILTSMIAIDPTDLADMGSDLALYLTQGNVALAFPITRYSGAAYAMRPGDQVDVLASMQVIDIDPEFRAALPNRLQLINETALEDGQNFLFAPFAAGRLEFIPELGVAAYIAPSGALEQIEQVPRRVTQLTIQQAEVIWVGTWEAPGEILEDEVAPLDEDPTAEQAQAQVSPDGQVAAAADTGDEEEELFVRREREPDVVILSMPLQDALALKFALDRGMNLDLALRSQRDNSFFITTSVNLPQLVEQGGLRLPDPVDFDLVPRADEVAPPSLPPVPPGDLLP